MATMDDLRRMETVDTGRGDVELGLTDAIQKHFSRHVVQRKPITQSRLDFERRRPRILREFLAEASGVFFYVYPGVAATASFILAFNNPETAANTSAFGSLLQVGLAFALGISFAIIVFGPVSGGHFNPAITLNFAVWQGFPWRKVPYYILAQIIGSFTAALMVMGQYRVQISEFSNASVAAGKGNVYNLGPASIFMTLPNVNQTNLGYLFLIEFFVDSFIALVIWACIDPANPFVSATTAPFAIGLAYATMVWGFADISISTNLARDLGCRMVAAIWYGGETFSYHNYSWIAILVNVPATFFGVAWYEILVRDSLQRIGKGAAVHEHGEEGLRKHVTREGIIEVGSSSALGNAKSIDSYESP